MKLEIIATSLEDAVIAEQGGADRLELCSALSEDGLTPSLGLIEAVVKGVEIPVNVIVRPHNRGFHYSKEDLQVMKEDIRHIKQVGANGIVIGALTKEGTVDQEAISFLLEESEGLEVTFHRAFDFAEDQFAALDVIATFPQIQRILTSGGTAPAPESIDQLTNLVEKAKEKSLKILVGSGVTPETAPSIIKETGAKEVHLGSGVRVGRSFLEPMDVELVASTKKSIQAFEQ